MSIEHETSSVPVEQTRPAVSWRERWRRVWSSAYLVPLCLILILVMAAYFRFLGLNWDSQTHLHPDERFIWMVELSLELPRSIGEYFNTAVSPLNPYNKGSSFIYGTFPLFLTKWLGQMTKLGDAEHIHLLGRALAASFDLVTVLLMFIIGRRLYDKRVGLLAALLAACTVILIQQAHFFTMDSFAATFVALTIYMAIRVAQRGQWRDFLWMGVAYGLAVACRINVAIVALPMGLACLVRIYNLHAAGESPAPPPATARSTQASGWQADIGGVTVALSVETPSAAEPEPVPAADPMPPDTATAESAPVALPYWLRVSWAVALRMAVCLLTAGLVFRIAQPYTFKGPGFFDIQLAEKWLADMRSWSPILQGKGDSYPSHQWASRPAVLFTLDNMVRWLLGWPLGLAAIAGWVLAWWELLCKRKLEHLLVLAWVTFAFFYHSTQFIKNSRYLVPAFPFMGLLGAYLLVWVWDRSKHVRLRWARPVAAALIVIVTVGTFLWAFAYTRIYTRPLSRVTASLWVYDNIPAGSAITYESWDDAIPWGGVGGRNGFADGTYIAVETHPYAEDTPEKLGWFLDWLNRADYVILSSNREWASIPRIPMRYPMTTRYYKYLFNGELGFDLIKTITSRPNLGPIEFVDDDAEETYTVYDHPKVLIFQKTPAYSEENARRLLSEGIDFENIARLLPIQVDGWKNGLQMTEDEAAIQRAGGTWSKLFNRQSLVNAVPVLVWLLLVEALGLVTLPLAYTVFSGLRDRGYILAKTLGILLLTWVTWMAVNLGLTGYSRTAIASTLLVLTACSALLLWRKREEMLPFWRQHKQLIAINEVLFLVFFGLFLLIRYGNPDLWHPVMGGEKPMDFAYLNAVIRSSTFPPYDPWYAGGYLNYYYFGQVIVATLIKLTGIVPWVGYNLAIPLLAALTAMGAFCVVYNLTARDKAQAVEDAAQYWRLRLGSWSLRIHRAVLWGLLAAMMVAVLGNLAEIAVLGRALMDIGRVEARSSSPALQNLARILSGLIQWVTGKAKPYIAREWPYWNPSRVMPNGEINEFPFFTFLYADLHAHLIALPFGLLALGMAVGIVRGAGGSRRSSGTLPQVQTSEYQSLAAWLRHAWAKLSTRVEWSEAAWLGAVALTVGALRCINSWDYPTYLLVVGVALVLREYELRGHTVDLQGIWAVAWRSAAIFVLSTLFFQPFLSRFATAYVAFERWKGPRTGLGSYLGIHGLFLFVMVTWMLVELFGRESRSGPARMLRLVFRHWDRIPRLLSLYARLVRRGREFDGLMWAAVGSIGLVLAWLVKSKEWFYVFLALLILGTLLLVLRRRMQPERRLVWLLFGFGLALSLGVELIVLKGDIGRMNTVFKFYLQLWVFWAVGTAFALSQIAEHSRAWTQRSRNVWWGVFGLLIFLAALYPVLAGKAKIQDRYDVRAGPSLDGMAYMQYSVYNDNGQPIELKWDRDAVLWLLENVQGTPVIAEGNTEERGLYRWGSRVSIYTGMPTILGWSWHQRQQRSAMPGQWIDRRLRDISTLYRSVDPSEAQEILKRYDVRYIYLGELERIYYPGPGLDKFEVMRAQGVLKLAYHNEKVMIYEVVNP